jgi:hypothetical protein
MKCGNLAFNAQGSRVIVVVGQVGAVKVQLEAVEALRKMERGGQNKMKLSLPPKYGAFLSFTPP